MIDKWEKRKILIWGKTRPELSMSYKETVCTGGVFEDTKRLVRLYPIPLRYLDDERYFKKYQWIEAYISKASRDARKESYKIRADEIRVLDTIEPKSGNWDARAEWIFQPDNVFQSIEALQEAQQRDNTSLGLIKPGEVKEIKIEKVSEKDKAEFWQRYQAALQQLELQFEPEPKAGVKPLSPPDFRFKVVFRCDDVDALFEHVRASGQAEVLQEPADQFYGVRDCAFRDPAGNLLEIIWLEFGERPPIVIHAMALRPTFYALLPNVEDS